MNGRVPCYECKGRYCGGGKTCPVLHKLRSQQSVAKHAKQDFFGAAPNVFVGRHGYPDINVGILGTEQYKDQDDPITWTKENYSIEQVVSKRSSLINSNFKTSIRNFQDKMLDLSQELSLSKKPADVEINLAKKPTYTVDFNQIAMPVGPSVKLKKARATENVRVPTAVDKVVSDTDLKAAPALEKLYSKGFDEHYLTKILTVGNLGMERNRKLVPTRWGITATDDTIGKKLIQEVKDYNESDYTAYFGGHLGNYYLVLMFPHPWSYELFETYVGSGPKQGAFGTDFEPFTGRKDYAHETAGGYYAARLGVLEELKRRKRQASVLCLRFITDEYWAPLGVWVCREATRNSLQSKPLTFASKELMLTYAKNLVRKKFGFDLDRILGKSRLMKESLAQHTLGAYA